MYALIRILIMFSFSLSFMAHGEEPATPTPQVDAPKKLSPMEKKEQISPTDLLLNSRPQALFLEVRPQVKSVPLYSEANVQSPVIYELKPNQIIKVVLDIHAYVEREKALREGKGFWHKVDFFENENLMGALHLFETYESIKAMRMSHYYLPVKKTFIKEFKTYALFDTRVSKNGQEISLKYQLSESEDKNPSWWLPAEKFERAIDRYFVSQFDCYPLSVFTRDLKFTEKLVKQFDMLPDKSKAIRDQLSEKVYLAKQEQKVTSLKRNWVRKEVYALSDDENPDVIEREEVDLGMDLGGRIGFETISLRQTSDLADISYESKNYVIGLAGYVPLFLDVEVLFKGEASFPAEQTFTDNIKHRDLEIADVYQLSFDQAFVFTTSPNAESPWAYQYGLGITYKGFMSKDLNFAYDTLFGLNFLFTANYKRFVSSFKVSPLGNQLILDAKSRDLEAILGFILIDNEYYRDFIIYAKINNLTLNVPEEKSYLEVTKIQAGLSLGF